MLKKQANLPVTKFNTFCHSYFSLELLEKLENCHIETPVTDCPQIDWSEKKVSQGKNFRNLLHLKIHNGSFWGSCNKISDLVEKGGSTQILSGKDVICNSLEKGDESNELEESFPCTLGKNKEFPEKPKTNSPDQKTRFYKKYFKYDSFTFKNMLEKAKNLHVENFLTKPTSQKFLTKLIERNTHNLKSKVIVDATACIGCDTLHFSQMFKKVYAIEIDKERYNVLQDSVSNNVKKNVLVFQDDCLTFFKTKNLYSDVIYIDPPWGGDGYKTKYCVDLYLSEIPLIDIVKDLLEGKYLTQTKCVVLKLPYNYNFDSFYDVFNNENKKSENFTESRWKLNYKIDRISNRGTVFLLICNM